jgi:hypothetical protein
MNLWIKSFYLACKLGHHNSRQRYVHTSRVTPGQFRSVQGVFGLRNLRAQGSQKLPHGRTQRRFVIHLERPLPR